MSAPDRTVQRLRLRAHDEQAVQRLLPRLDDALRCASLPDAGGRLILVRRLALGPVRLGWPAQRLSQCIEDRVREQAVVAGAGCVVFDSRLAACTELARRLLQGEPCDAWYWRLVVPGALESASVPDAVCRVAQALAAQPEAAVALPAWARALVDAGCGEGLTQAVGAQVLEGWLRVGAARASTGPVAPHSQGFAESQARPHRAGAKASDPAAPGQEPRIAALPSAGAAAGHEQARAAVTADGRHEGAVATPVAGLSARRASSNGRRVVASGPMEAPGAAAPVAAPIAAPQSRRRQPKPAPAAVRLPPAAPASPAAALPATAATPGGPTGAPLPTPPAQPLRAVSSHSLPPLAQAPTHGLPVADPGMPTASGGLLFLLPVLARLGLPDQISERQTRPDEPPGALAATVLQAALSRLRADSDDPVRAALDAAAAEPDDAARAWLHASRRWLRRQAGIGLASLVRRPARVVVTPTHVDLFFDLGAVDLRVRRQGLDVDPGWVPWFGRVVSFHYGRWPR